LRTGYAANSDYVIDTTIAGVRVGRGETRITVGVNRPCEYDLTFETKVCPRCSRSDSIIPISYDVPRVHSENFIPSGSHQGVYTVKETGYEFYDGGERLVDCVPRLYCKRDQNKF
jgi:hypothetical protein